MNMKWLSKFMIALVAVAALASCVSKKSPDEIFKDEASGVVLVMNRYYYAVTIEGEEDDALYFSRLDEDGDIDIDDIGLSPDSVSRQTSFGTAFFVDKGGTLLTNRHVVDCSDNLKRMKRSVKDFIGFIKYVYEQEQEELADEYAAIEKKIKANTTVKYDAYYGYYTAESPDNDRLRRRQKELEDQYAENAEAIEEFESIDMSDINVKACCEISIAYNDQFATSKEDFKPCVVVRVSDDEDTDLALIRLKNKKTPEEAHVFTVPVKKALFSPNPEKRGTLNINQTLVMIGYNYGPKLATTGEGLQAQLTTGTVSQIPDDNRVLYSIPVLQGSSGSPVLNQYGELVAVNFAGVKDSQSFNFGIPLSRIKSFINNR